MKSMLNDRKISPSNRSQRDSSIVNLANHHDIDLNRKQIDSLREKLNMKLSALNAIKSNSSQQDDSKVDILNSS
jgi:hypothetical protein